MSTAETQSASEDVECLIHLRFNPDGTVAEIGERPSGSTPQQWFTLLSHSTLNRYQALAGGRGLFRLPKAEVDKLKAEAASGAQS